MAFPDGQPASEGGAVLTWVTLGRKLNALPRHTRRKLVTVRGAFVTVGGFLGICPWGAFCAFDSSMLKAQKRPMPVRGFSTGASPLRHCNR